jgi:type II secretory pathway predicted ATPase ExeA
MTTPLQKLCDHFTLSAPPFSRDVPPDGLYRHKTFTESLERLLFAVDARSPALLSAPPGTGKSILLDAVRQAVDKSDGHFVYTALTSCGPFGLIGQLAARYGTPLRRSTAQTATALLEELARSSKTEILFLDDAHHLPDASLQELRLLGNLDFDRKAPFCLLLAGHPPLRERLQQPDFDALWQRLQVRASLQPLTDRETGEYLERRLRAVGARTTLFRPAAQDLVFQHSRGVMRLVGTLATFALLAAARAGRRHVEAKDVQDALFELDAA